MLVEHGLDLGHAGVEGEDLSAQLLLRVSGERQLTFVLDLQLSGNGRKLLGKRRIGMEARLRLRLVEERVEVRQLLLETRNGSGRTLVAQERFETANSVVVIASARP